MTGAGLTGGEYIGRAARQHPPRPRHPHPRGSPSYPVAVAPFPLAVAICGTPLRSRVRRFESCWGAFYATRLRSVIGQKVFAFSARCRPLVVSLPQTPLWLTLTRRCSALIVSGPTSPSAPISISHARIGQQPRLRYGTGCG